jgi:hypothetical protein
LEAPDTALVTGGKEAKAELRAPPSVVAAGRTLRLAPEMAP